MSWKHRAFVDGDFQQHPDKTLLVHEEPKTFRVTYWGDRGQKFRVKVHQKPNPIGFHARLPGDRKAR